MSIPRRHERLPIICAERLRQDAAGGKEFATGKYDNQVMLYIAPKENVYYIRLA